MRLGLGTVQFGLDYGVSNRMGKTEARAVREILDVAAANGIRVLDTAHAYGESETVLGQSFGLKANFQIITKTPASLAQQRAEAGTTRQAILEAFTGSLCKLGVQRVHGLLVHHGMDLTSPAGEEIWATLQAIKAEGRVEKIGASVYAPEELESILARYPIDIVQLPLNPLDQRFLQSGLLNRLHDTGITVHSRSAFLQGLFLLPPKELSTFFDPVRSRLERFHARAQELDLSPLGACLAFSLQQDTVDALICGVNTKTQLEELCAATACLPLGALDFDEFAFADRNLLEPRYWPKP